MSAQKMCDAVNNSMKRVASHNHRPVGLQAAKRSTSRPRPSLPSSLWLSSQRSSPTPRSRRHAILCASLLPLASITAVQPAAVAAVPAWHAGLVSCGVFIVCCAAAALLLSAIPVLWSMVRTANRMESMLQTLEAEMPDTAASVRLSSMELSDCLNELGALGNDLSSGVRASARLVSSAESGLRQGAQLLGSSLVPALAKRETQLRDGIEAALKARAALAPEISKARAAIAASTTTARRVRGALMLGRAAATAINLGRAFRGQLVQAAAQRIVEQEAAAAAEAAALRRWQQQQRQQQQQRKAQSESGGSGSGGSGSSSSQQQRPKPA